MESVIHANDLCRRKEEKGDRKKHTSPYCCVLSENAPVPMNQFLEPTDDLQQSARAANISHWCN